MFWHLKPPAPEEFIKQFPEYSPIALRLLFERGLTTRISIDEFFSPDYNEDLHDPFLMLGMKEAVKRVLKAIDKKEKIAIFGDYDADGVCGAVILKSVLEILGVKEKEIEIYIPDRNREGYGLNLEAVKKIAEQKIDLIITVDCGITDFEEIELANSLGVEVIITDHHLVAAKLPKAKIIINPWQKKDNYPFKELAGAGVAFKLAQGLLKKTKAEIPAGWEKWLLDLVALATVADCVPLLGENRTLVRYGLIVLAQTQRIGLKELMEIARLNPIFEAETLTTNLDSYSLGFILAPRLNAAGRLEHAAVGFKLLTTEDPAEAKILAKKIDSQNRQRQKITDEIVAEVEKRAKDYLTSENQPVIVERDAAWSPGLVGLAAGKITDRYHRPAVIFSQKENGFLRGSVRSISGFNIVEALEECADLIGEFGGHAAAAGLSLEDKNYLLFKERINQIARRKLKKEDLIPQLEIDSEVQPEEINWELFDSLTRFEPFGQRNKEPKFLVRDLRIVNCRMVGNGQKHLKLELKSDRMPGKIFKAIGFGLANGQNNNLKTGDKVDLVFELLADEWNGNKELQMKMLDIHKTMC